MSTDRARVLFWVNALTLSRIPGVFAFMVAALIRAHGGGTGWAWLAMLLLVGSALTDLFDGWLARRHAATSAFGAHADPLADKAFYLVVLPTFVYLVTRMGASGHALSLLILTVLFLMRDQWVSFLRAVGAAAGLSGAANKVGKLRTLLSFVYFCILYFILAVVPVPVPVFVMIAVEGLLTGLTLFSIVVYTRVYRDALRTALHAPAS